MGETALIAYSASKSAINQLTRSIATQYGKLGNRCNAIAPGMILTDNVMVTPARIAKYERHHLTPYVGHPNVISHMVAFMASDAARFITAQTIWVDGGICAYASLFAEDWEAQVVIPTG